MPLEPLGQILQSSESIADQADLWDSVPKESTDFFPRAIDNRLPHPNVANNVLFWDVHHRMDIGPERFLEFRKPRLRCDFDEELFPQFIEAFCRSRMQLDRHTRESITYRLAPPCAISIGRPVRSTRRMPAKKDTLSAHCMPGNLIVDQREQEKTTVRMSVEHFPHAAVSVLSSALTVGSGFGRRWLTWAIRFVCIDGDSAHHR